MDLQEKLCVLQKQLDLQIEYKLLCNGVNCSINYSNEDFERESMLIKKIKETKDLINSKNK